MSAVLPEPAHRLKQPKNLSPRIQWLRDYYFQGVQRRWNNEMTAWTTGTSWDFQYEEIPFYIVPETYAFFQTFRSSFQQTARPVTLYPDFWTWSLPERKAWFNRAQARILAGDKAGALSDLDRAIELAPQLAIAWLNRGVLRNERGDRAGALADWRQGLAAEPQGPFAGQLRQWIAAAEGGGE